MKKYKHIYLLFVLAIYSVVIYAQQPVWTEVAPGVWKGVVGKPEAYDLLKATGPSPNSMALSKMATAAFPLSQTDIIASVSDNKTFLRLSLIHI